MVPINFTCSQVLYIYVNVRWACYCICSLLGILRAASNYGWRNLVLQHHFFFVDGRFSAYHLTVKVVSLLECLFLPQISLPASTNRSLSKSPLISFSEEYEKQLGVKLIHNTDHAGSFFALAVAYPSCKVWNYCIFFVG